MFVLDADAASIAQSRFTDIATSCWIAPPDTPLSTWAEQHLVLSSEYSARTSNIRLFQYQREVFDTFTDPAVREVVLKCARQTIKTIYLQAVICYIIAERPGPILFLEPNEEDAKEFSKERLAPMIRDCEILRGRVSDSTHDGQNTILGKAFPGGRLSIVSVRVPGNVARRSICYLLGDETNKWPISTGKEGDPWEIAKECLTSFGTRAKAIRTCSPTTADGAISKAYEESDQRKPWVPCRYCNIYQMLTWQQLKWDSSLAKEQQHQTAYYECANLDCRKHWSDADRWWSCDKLEWRASKPFLGIAGFWINHLYSPWKKMSQIVRHFLRVKDDREQLQVFKNTVLAEDWEEQGETPEPDVLYGRRESYPFGADAVIPRRALFLTAGVDMQDAPPRLECEVRAWGRHRESWSIGYFTIQAYDDQTGVLLPITDPRIWEQLEAEVLNKQWEHESGVWLGIWAMAIDTGFKPRLVYEFALRHPQISYSAQGARVYAPRTVIPVKGTNDHLRIVAGVSRENAARKRQHVRIVSVGTHCAKQELFDALKIVPRSMWPDDQPQPGRIHFPMYDKWYFDGLCSEMRLYTKRGVVYQLRAGMRNEPLDTSVYCRAAAAVIGIDRFSERDWAKLERAVHVVKPVDQDDKQDNPQRDEQNQQDAVKISTSYAPPHTPPRAQQINPNPSQASQVGQRPVRAIRGRFL